MEQSYYWIYILRVKNDTLYTGYTSHILRRYLEHLKGTAASKYTRAFKADKLLQCWRVYEPVGTVLKLEWLIKRQQRKKKLSLITSPELLKPLAEKKLTGPLKVYTFDPGQVLARVEDHSLKELSGSPDLFQHLPARDF